MTHMGSEVERHIRQNNERLRCIQRHLQTPEGFEKAAKELLEWCSDPRAFQKAFEASLMNCLTVISDVAPKPGFDLSLGYRLLAICSGSRDKFSPKSSSKLHYWCEELGRLLLLQHQENRPDEGMKPRTNPSPVPHMGINYPHGPMGGARGYPQESPGWNQGGGMPNPGQMPQRPQHPSVSVITTVWGVTNTTQTPSLRGQSHPPMNTYSQHIGPGQAPHPRPHGQAPGYHMNNYNHQKPGNYAGQAPFQRQDSFGQSMGGGTHRNMHGPGYGPNPTNHQTHHVGGKGGEYPPPAAAAAAAAVAAAAATATATATATLIANDQQQNEIFDPMGQHRSSSMHQMDPNTMHPHGPNMNHSSLMRSDSTGNHSGMMSPGVRGPPRPNMPPQYGQPPRNVGPGPPMNPPHHPASSPIVVPHSGYNGMGQPYRPTYRSNQRGGYGPGPYDPVPTNQFKSPQMASNHPHTPSPFSPRISNPSPQVSAPLLTATPDLYPTVSSAGSNSQYFPNAHTMNNNPTGPHPSQGPTGYTPQRHPYTSQYNPGLRGPLQQAQPPNPIPGNPTPPLTPGSAHNVPPYPGPDMKPPVHSLDVKPNISNPGSLPPMEETMPNSNSSTNNDEMRMTFPVRDGIVLEPFRLEHNRSVSTHAFYLRPTAYQTLMWRSDLELQFKCYHHDDKMQYTNWPHSVQVNVNNMKMHIPRNPVSKPLYLRNVCQQGRNAIEITVSSCCCSHLFVLQLVHRPSVRSVLMGLLQKRMLPAPHCVTKIKRYFMSGILNSNKGMIGSPMGNGVTPGGGDENSVVVSLRCPITFRRISLPARGNECKHIQCFDLEAYLQLNSDKRTWMCPICKKSALLEGLEVDQYIWGILKESHPEDMEVTIDQRCVWKPVLVKRENAFGNDEQEGPPNKRFRSNGMSPDSMFNHLPSPGSYVPQMTPLPPTRLTMTPDMNSSGQIGGSSGYSQPGGGCGGFHGGSNGYMNSAGNVPSSSNHMMNGGIMGNMSTAPSPINSMTISGMSNHTLHRAKPLQMDNIAADDRVTIEKRLNNHAIANNNGPSTASPNRQMSNPNSSGGINPQILANIKTEICGTPPQMSSNNNQRVRTPLGVSNLTPNTPGNANTPSMGLSPSLGSGNSSNNAMNNISVVMEPVTPAGGAGPHSITGNELNFDPTDEINGSALDENNEKIPYLEILPAATLDLIDIFGADADGGTNDDDIFSMFDSTT